MKEYRIKKDVYETGVVTYTIQYKCSLGWEDVLVCNKFSEAEQWIAIYRSEYIIETHYYES
jgi:hypothetical protein